ncbi:MAG: D-cysteine desulfhydrase family protein [Caldilineaceae bacterium]|nr:D-cysteine desulfhydrase family protein [Caldilineaceae bacterium]
MHQEKAQQLEAAIARLPRTHLGLLPTPLEALPRLSAALGGPPIYIKRDDLTGLGFGGNKTRMLELSLAEGLARGADTVVFGAAVQSNYCRQLAAACAKLGLELHLYLRPERPIDQEEIQGNQLLQRLFGAQVTILAGNDRSRQQEIIKAAAEALRQAGKNVYFPRQPDTVDLDVIAYAESALEIARQCDALGIAPQAVYVTAFDTTQAGTVLGLAYLESTMAVKGFTPLAMPHDQRIQKMVDIANQAATRLGLAIELSAQDFDNDDSFIGERYAIPTPEGMEAVRLLARTEGILLDPVYTGKGFAALIQHIRTGKLDPTQPVLFLHTGGAPALFGYARDLLAE